MAHDAVEYDGLRFARYSKNPYYWTKHYPERGLSKSLHVHVWEKHHGPRPDGFQIHHVVRDFRTTDPAHLECIPRSEHARLHALERRATGSLQDFNDLSHQRAAEWHRSEAGRAWHKEHGRQTWDNAVPEIFSCVRCGDDYITFARSRKRGFCSPNCITAARKESGVDDEDRTCAVCSAAFRVNRYSRVVTCSASCGGTLAAARRYGRA